MLFKLSSFLKSIDLYSKCGFSVGIISKSLMEASSIRIHKIGILWKIAYFNSFFTHSDVIALGVCIKIKTSHLVKTSSIFF